MSARKGRGQFKDIDGIQRPTKPFVGLADGKGRFRTLLSVSSNFANLNPYTEVMQLERSRGCIISKAQCC